MRKGKHINDNESKLDEQLEEVETMFADDEEGEESKVESGQEQNVLKYISPSKYNYIEERGEVGESLIRRDAERLYCDRNIVDLDVVCQIGISQMSTKCKIITKSSKSALVCTPHLLYDRKIISTGRYTEWKQHILDTPLAPKLGFISKSFIFHKESLYDMLDYVGFALLILDLCLYDKNIEEEDADDEIGDKIWFYIESLLIKEKDMKLISELSDKSKNEIIKCLFDEVDINIDGVPRWLSQLRVQGGDEIPPKYNLDQKREFLQSLKDVVSKLKCEQSKKLDINPNVNFDHTKFASYLAPIIATICENYDKNPFIDVDHVIWKSRLPVNQIDINIEDTMKKNELTQNYALLEHYILYSNWLAGASVGIHDYQEYRNYCALFVEKIEDKLNPVHKNRKDWRLLQYYSIESMLGLQFIDSITKEIHMIVNKIAPHSQSYVFSRSFILWEGLERIYNDFDVFSRIDIARQFVRMVFRNDALDKKNYSDVHRKNRKILKLCHEAFEQAKASSLDHIIYNEYNENAIGGYIIERINYDIMLSSYSELRKVIQELRINEDNMRKQRGEDKYSKASKLKNPILIDAINKQCDEKDGLEGKIKSKLLQCTAFSDYYTKVEIK